MDRVVIFMLVLVLGVSLLAAGAANATVYYVDAGRPDDTGAGTAWATAKKTIQAGINAGAGTDEVWVKAGTYVERITLRSSCCLYGGFAGTETLRTQRNWTTNVTIIDGSAGGSVVTMNTITNATLDGFTVQNGSATSGAGIYCATVSNTNTIANCRITGNTIPSGNGNGAGVYCTGGTFIHCTVSNNSIPYVASAISQGGGVYCTGGAFTDCTISGNANKGTRGGSGGGGIYCTGGTFTNCTISGNTCTSPGVYGAYGTGVGIYCTGGTFTNCTVCANVASGTSGLYCGGGVYCAGGAFMNCAVCGNSIGSQTTQGRGGGFYYSSGSITSCIVSGNTATAPILSARAQGGGVYCESRWPTLLTNCIVSGNVVNDEGGVTEGGGMYKGTAINCIISSNTAVGAERDGGGVWSTSSSQFKNCIFHGNTSRAIHGVSDPVVTNCLFYGNPDSDYYQNGTLLTGAAAINALAGNSGNVDGDPLFVMDGPAAITGTWTAAPIYNATTWQTTLTNAGASYTPNAFAGRLINTDTSQLSQAYIVSNTATEIVVWGDVTAYAASGDSYKLIDYHLRYGSGAADLGIGGSGVPTTDIEGNPRPVDVPGIGANGTGTEYDIGANEEQGPFPPSPPTNPGAISIGLNTITWTWQDNSSNETGFKVYDDPGAGPPTTLQFTTAANAQSWQHSGLNVNAQYAFQVAATIAAGDSAKTTNYIVWTLIEAVTGLTFSGVTTTGITVASTNTPSNLTSGTSGLYYANTTAGTNSGWVQSMTPWASSSLTPNTQYAFSSQSRNGASITTTAATGSKYTLASAPAIGNNVACDKTVSTLYPASTTFTFSNPAGFGAGTHGGSAYMASKFKYVWDTNATHTFTGMETDWNAGTVPQSPAGSGSYYLHLQSFNAEGVAGGTLDYGPFVIDTTIPTGTIQINTTTPGYINSSTVNLTLSASDAAGVAKMRFSNDGATWTPGSWASAPAYGTSYTVWTLTGGDGAKTVYAQYQDNAGNVSTSTISTTITLDTGLPTGSLSVNGGAVYANTTPVALTIFATDSGSGVAGMQFSNDNLTWSGWEPYGTGKAWTLTTGDGAKVVYVQYNDAAGNVSTGTISDGIMLDTAVPTGTVVINGGAGYTGTTAVSLGLSYADGTGSGAAQMQFSNDGSTWSGWESVAGAKAWALAAGDGAKTVYVQFKDGAGNVTTGPIIDGITLDDTPPTGTIIINAGAAYAASRNVTLTLSATDSGSGLSQMQFSNDNVAWSGWETYSASKDWTLSSGDGAKTVYAQYRDAAGNVSEVLISDGITLDQTPPTGTIGINGGALSTNSTSVTLTLSASDGSGSGVSQMQFSNDGSAWSTAESYAATKSWPLAAGADSSRTVHVRYQDTIGNWSGEISTGILLDTTAPTGTVSINNEIAVTSSLNVSLVLSASDGPGSGVTLMAFSNDNSVWSLPEAYKTTASWTLAPGTDGLRTVWVKYQDGAGTWSSGFPDTIMLDTSLPQGTISINAEAAYTLAQGVTLTLAATTQSGTITQMQLSDDNIVWTTAEPYASTRGWTLPLGADGLRTVYVRYKNSLDVWSPSIPDEITLDTVPPNGTISVNGGAAYTNDTDVTLTLASDDATSGVADMQFSNDNATWSGWITYATSANWTLSSGDGEKIVYAQYRDAAGNISTDTISDGISLDEIGPTGMVNINSGAAYTGNRSATLTLTSGDGSGSGVAEMQFSNDGATWSGWEAVAGTKVWTLASGDGPKTVHVQYRDAVGNVSIGTISDAITLDMTPPMGTVVINGGAAYTGTAAVTLSLAADDGMGSGVAGMQFSKDGVDWSGWEAYGTSKSWTLESVTDGLKTVYVQYRDGVGNVSADNVSDGITLDTLPPTATVSLLTPSPTSSDSVVFSVVFSEAVGTSFNDTTVSGAAGSLTGTAVVTGTDPNYTVTVTPTNLNANGTVGISIPGIVVTDRAGNAYGGDNSALCVLYNWPGMEQPQGAKLYVGGGHNLQIQIAEGGIPTTYQWRHKVGITVSDGPAAAQWLLANVSLVAAGDYWCEVTFDGVMHASDTVNIQVQPRISIITPPMGNEVTAGQSYLFTVVASGGYGTLSYQWKKGGANIDGANDSEFTLSNLTADDTANYSVEISDTNGDSIESFPVKLTVLMGLPLAGIFGLTTLAAVLAAVTVRRKRQ